MTVPAQDTLLDAPRTMRIVLQQLEVVVGLEQQDVRGAYTLNDQFGRIAKVGQEADPARVSVNQEPHGIVCVMGHAEGFNFYIADCEARASIENPEHHG